MFSLPWPGSAPMNASSVFILSTRAANPRRSNSFVVAPVILSRVSSSLARMVTVFV
jgi:hypothetical protein